MPKEKGLRGLTEADVNRLFTSGQYVHFIGMLMPPRQGVIECYQSLEHAVYPPGTEKNDDFSMILINWEGIAWGVVSIPRKDRALMDEHAARFRLQVKPGSPVMLGGEQGISHFPLQTDELYTLEYVSGHPAYGAKIQEV